MRQSSLILGTISALALTLWSCSDETAAPPPAAAPLQQFPQTGQQTYNANPCPTPSLPTDFSSTTTDISTDNDTASNGSSSSGFNDPNRTFLVQTDTNGTGTTFGSDSSTQGNDNLMNQGSTIPSTSSNCPDTNINIQSGDNSVDNEQINNFMNPPEKKTCNSNGNTWHWYKGGGGTCLTAFKVQASCDSSFYSQHFGSFTSNAEKVRMDGHLSSGYNYHQCGVASNGDVYFSAFKLNSTDTGASLDAPWLCTGGSLCPTNTKP